MIVHLNGQLLPVEQARIGVLDRGFLFGDGMYEGLRAFGGRVVAMDLHVERLRDGLRAARIPWDAAAMAPLTAALLKANKLEDAFIYWQVTRGSPAPGQPVRTRIPPRDMTPSVFGYAVAAPNLDSYSTVPTKSCICVEDFRWLKGRVKSISLIGNVIEAIEAHEAGAEDAVLVRNGLVAEGTSANLLLAIPSSKGVELVTPSLDSVPILAGVTRSILLQSNPQIIERPVRAEELARAVELMLLGTFTMVTSITKLDNKPVGTGKPGPQARALLDQLTNLIKSGH